ncbi:MAG: LytR/AlgR family response regulator transcription factor [Pseudobacter sp.]|uniref:LytR/AlgR family response regulator transcription factor n=1 Tax=Pseudobacter sp. TaxID=2045420 RepID=UPI003F7DA51C
MARPLTCIVVDDQEIDRLTTLSLVKKHPQLQVAGVYDNPGTALTAVQNSIPDIAFLDVDMPAMSGLELRRQLQQIPACVFITSYPEYAAESFEVAALDFIVKPLKSERFAKTVDRLQEFFTILDKAALLDHSLGSNTIFIKDGHHQVKLPLHEIIYLEALKDYTRIVTLTGKHCILSSLGNLLKENEFNSFIRIHKSFAVQKHFIERIKAQEIEVRGTILPVGRTYKDALSGLK